MPQPALSKTSTVHMNTNGTSSRGVIHSQWRQSLYSAAWQYSCSATDCVCFVLSDRFLVWLHDLHVSNEASNNRSGQTLCLWASRGYHMSNGKRV